MTMAELESSQAESFEEARYDLSPEQADSITREFLASRDVPEGRYYCTVVTDETGSIANVARTVESSVFNETFENDTTKMASLYTPYEPFSRFYTVFDTEANRAVGVLRVIENSEEGIPTFNTVIDNPEVVDGVTWDKLEEDHGIEKDSLDRIWDVGTLALLKDYRRGTSGVGPSALLYRALLIGVQDNNIEHIVTVIDEKALGALRKLGIPFENMCDSESFPFEGSEHSFAAIGVVDDVLPNMMRREQELRQEMVRAVASQVLKLTIEYPAQDAKARRRERGKVMSLIGTPAVIRQIVIGSGLDEHTQLLTPVS